MELTPEDNLRLNVLLANQPRAIRINESRMTLHAWSERGEATVQLNPNCKDERYLRRVRELLSGHVLGSPGGYPVYLRRWSRMGQARNAESLAQLLLLGEPEAVVAVVNSPDLTPELGQHAWWAMSEPENARAMLANPRIAGAPLGHELAVYLVEYLPFEEDPLTLAESVALVLQEGLLDTETRHKLWLKGRQKNVYHLGFLIADAVPEAQAARGDAAAVQAALAPLADNPVAVAVLRTLAAPGQSFVQVAGQILRKPVNQDIVNRLLEVVAGYFAALRPAAAEEAELEILMTDAAHWCDHDPAAVADLSEVLVAVPDLRDTLAAMLVLARLSYAVVRPVFSRTDAMGTLMRRKLEPVTTPLLAQLQTLLQAGS